MFSACCGVVEDDNTKSKMDTFSKHSVSDFETPTYFDLTFTVQEEGDVSLCTMGLPTKLQLLS